VVSGCFWRNLQQPRHEPSLALDARIAANGQPECIKSVQSRMRGAQVECEKPYRRKQLAEVAKVLGTCFCGSPAELRAKCDTIRLQKQRDSHTNN